MLGRPLWALKEISITMLNEDTNWIQVWTLLVHTDGTAMSHGRHLDQAPIKHCLLLEP